MKEIPLCHKCYSAITELNLAYNCYELIGCKECAEIENWQDAKVMCPLLKENKE
jgi:hypothetical protein